METKTIIFDYDTVNLNVIIEDFLYYFKQLQLENNKIKKLTFEITDKVELIDELFYSYILLFCLKFPETEVEISFKNNNPVLYSVAQNKINQFKNENIKCAFSSPYRILDGKIREEKSITPSLIVNSSTAHKLFKKNNFLLETNILFKQNKSEFRNFTEKDEFLKLTKELKKDSFVWQFYLASLDDLSILRMFYKGEHDKIDYRFDKFSIDTSEGIVKKIFWTLRNKNFFDFNEIQIYLFRIFIDKLKPKTIDVNTEKKLITYCNKLGYLIDYIISISIGIEELAKNIVEHSGENLNEGFGVISARVFSDNKFANTKDNKYNSTSFNKWLTNVVDAPFFLDLNIIDAGIMDIRSNYIKKISTQLDKETLNHDKTILEKEKISLLFNYQKIKLKHQERKLISRLGLLLFTEKVLSKNGYIQFSTNSLNLNENTCLYYDFLTEKIIDNQNKKINPIGTSYNFILPLNQFLPNELNKKDKVYSIPISSAIDNMQSMFKYEYVENKDYENDSEKYYLKRIHLHEAKIENKYNKNTILSKLILANKKGNEILVLDSDDNFLKENLTSSSDWIRFLATLQIDTSNSIIILGTETFYREIYLEIIKVNQFMSKAKIDFWNSSNSLLFYFKINYENENKQLSIWFCNLLSGKSYNDYLNINRDISLYHFNTYAISSKINYLKKEGSVKIDKHLFFADNKLLNFELLLLSKESKLLFIDTVESLLNLEITPWKQTNNKIKDKYFQQFSGFKISNSHFKLGSKIHINDFYYAKRLFYNSFYANRFSYLFAKQILKNIENHNKKSELTLVGYENYSELLVSNTRILLEKLGYENIKHNIVVNNKTLKNAKNIHSKIQLIIPISSTFSTSKKLRDTLNFISTNNSSGPRLSFLEPDLTAILVSDTDFKMEELILKEENIISNKDELNIENTNPHDLFTNDKYKIFNWHRNILNTEIIANSHRQFYFVNVTSKWNLIYNCELCYPEKKETEVCLLDIENNGVTPDLIFDLPKISKPFFFKTQNIFDILYIKEIGSINIINSPVKRKNKFYKFYLKPGTYLHKSETNKKNVIDWLKNIKSNFEHFDKVVILKQSEITTSGFVDIVNEHIFEDKATIIQFSAHDDNLQNFIKFHVDVLEDANVVFVDDILDTGNAFWLINDYLKSVKFKDGTTSKISNCIFLFNKMNYYEEKILEAELGKNGLVSNLNFYAKLNILTLLNERENQYSSKRIKIYEKLKSKSLLDQSRIFFSEEESRLNAYDLDNESNTHTNEPKDLLIPLLFHELYSIFSFDNEFYVNEEKLQLYLLGSDKIEDKKVGLQNIIEYIINCPSIQKFKSEINSSEQLFSDNDITLNLIKILSEPPFSRYKYLKEIAFDWVLEKNKSIVIDDELIVQKNSYYNNYQEIKFLLRMAVNLNINYIFSIDFIYNVIKPLIDNLSEPTTITNYRKKFDFNTVIKRWEYNFDLKKTFSAQGFITYYTCLIQELISEDEAKAVELVKNIWHLVNDNEKKIIDSEKGFLNLKNDFNNPYLTILKVLVLENNFIFDKLMNQFFKDTKSIPLVQNNNLLNIETYIKDIKKNKKNKLEDFISNKVTEYRTESLERMLARYNYDSSTEKFHYSPDENLKKAFFHTLILQIALRNEIEDDDAIPNPSNIEVKENEIVSFESKNEFEKKINELKKSNDSYKDIQIKINNMLEMACHILNIKDGGAYFTIRYKNKKVREDEILPSDLYTLSQFASSKEFELDDILETDNSLLLKIFNGIKDVGRKKPKSTYELFRVNSKLSNWEYKAVTGINDDFVSNSVETNFDCDYNNLYFLRISNIKKESFGKFGRSKKFYANPIAVITFYGKKIGKTTEHGLPTNEHFDPKRIRFLLLLRDYIQKFIYDHLDNDSLAGFIAEEENRKTQNIYKHGMSLYKNTFKVNLDKLISDHNNKLFRSIVLTNFDYLTNKLGLIHNFDNDDRIMNYSTERIIELFDYYVNTVMQLEFTEVNIGKIPIENFVNIEDSKLIEFKRKISKNLPKKILKVPNNVIKEIIFELIFNVRKHINYKTISSQNPLIIILSIYTEENYLIIKLSNNHCKNSMPIKFKKTHKSKGINLINLCIQRLNIANSILTNNDENGYTITLKFILDEQV